MADELTREIDAQLFPFGVQITLPNGIEFRLGHDDADTLGHMLTEARLNRAGLQPISVPATDVKPGDIFSNLGLTVWEVKNTPAGVFIFFYGGSSISVGRQLEVTVNRRIE